MILDPVIMSDILIDGPSAAAAADAIRELSASGEPIAPTFIGAGEIARYVLFLGKLRPFLFRHEGVRKEVEAVIQNLFSSGLTTRETDTSSEVMTAAYRLSATSSLNYSVAHLASTAIASRELCFCARGTIVQLSGAPGITIEIVKEFDTDAFAVVSISKTK